MYVYLTRECLAVALFFATSGLIKQTDGFVQLCQSLALGPYLITIIVNVH